MHPRLVRSPPSYLPVVIIHEIREFPLVFLHLGPSSVLDGYWPVVHLLSSLEQAILVIIEQVRLVLLGQVDPKEMPNLLEAVCGSLEVLDGLVPTGLHLLEDCLPRIRLTGAFGIVVGIRVEEVLGVFLVEVAKLEFLQSLAIDVIM